MSGKPYPAGVQRVVDLLDLLGQSGDEERKLSEAEARAKVVREERSKHGQELTKLLRDMDLESPGNYGYEGRLVWFLAEMRRRAAVEPDPTGAARRVEAQDQLKLIDGKLTELEKRGVKLAPGKISAVVCDLLDHRCDRYETALLPGVSFCRKDGARQVGELVQDLRLRAERDKPDLAALRSMKLTHSTEQVVASEDARVAEVREKMGGDMLETFLLHLKGENKIESKDMTAAIAEHDAKVRDEVLEEAARECESHAQLWEGKTRDILNIQAGRIRELKVGP